MAKSRRATPIATRSRRQVTQGKPARQPRVQEQEPLPSPVARPRQTTATPRAPKAATEQTLVGYKVRAIDTGYYDHGIRREGDVFLIAKLEDFSEKWMEYVDAATPERISTAQQEIRRKNIETATSRMPGAIMPGVHDEPMANEKNPLKA